MGEKNGLSPTFLFSSRSVSVTLCSMYMWTLSHICILTTTSGSFRLTLFFFDRRAPALRISFWESTSFIIPSNLLARMANVPSGSSTSDSPEMSSGVYSPRYLPMLWVSEMRSAMGSRNLSSNDATMYPGPFARISWESVSASTHFMASARAMSFVSPDSSKKKLDFTIGQIDTALIIASAKGRGGEKVPLPVDEWFWISP